MALRRHSVHGQQGQGATVLSDRLSSERRLSSDSEDAVDKDVLPNQKPIPFDDKRRRMGQVGIIPTQLLSPHCGVVTRGSPSVASLYL
jgi:hypothetical protein